MIYGQHTSKFQSFLSFVRIERWRCLATSPAHVEVQLDALGAGPQVPIAYTREDTIPADMTVLKCRSAETAWYLGHLFGATHEEIVSSDPSELCVAIGPQSKRIKGKAFPVSCIFLWRTVMQDTVFERDVARWLAPCATDVVARAEALRGPTARAQAHSLDVQRYDSQKPLRQSPKTRLEAHECVCCLDHPAEYKMENCTHTISGVALLCLECKTFLLRQAQKANNSNRQDLKFPCPICRELGRFKRFIWAEPGA